MDGPVANVEMAAAWDGEEGEDWARNAEHHDRIVARHHAVLLAAAAIGASEQVLDIGCGNGQTTLDAARAATAGNALGVDLSGPMLRTAADRAKAAGITNVRFEQADAQVHQFERNSFDVLLSRFGAMFFDDPIAAFTNLYGATRSGGRLTLLAWQALDRNEWLVEMRRAMAAGRELPTPPIGTPGPFGLADRDAVCELLTNSGYRDADVSSVEEPMCFGDTADEAFGFARATGIVRGLLADLDDEARARALDDLESMVHAHEGPDGVTLASAAWLITATKEP
jgi:SAM-dependent methyltransferase